jgi:hypothetical protein
MSGPHPRPPLLPEGFGFPAGFAAAALVTAAAVAGGAREHPALSLAGLTCVVLATAVTSTLPAAAGTAVAAWALHTGFVVGRFGALSFTRAGLVTGLVLALTAALAAAARRLLLSGPNAADAHRPPARRSAKRPPRTICRTGRVDHGRRGRRPGRARVAARRPRRWAP